MQGKSDYAYIQKNNSPVYWGCRIHWLHHCRVVRSHNECPAYDTKQSESEALGMQSTPSFLGLLWPGVVTPDMGQIELTLKLSANKWL